MPSALVENHVSSPRIEALEKPVRGHIAELDSLRGVAALFVLFDHFLRVWRQSSSPQIALHLVAIPFIANGKAAVMMFFALSGFVLTLPFLKGKSQGYAVYALRRICRIYIPYVVALLLALLACRNFHGEQMQFKEFRATWSSLPSLGVVAQHLLFLGKFDTDALDPPIWSLVHEMRISLIFPLLCLIALRLRGSIALLLAAAFPVAATVLQLLSHTHAGELARAEAIAWLKTLGFCGTFLLGSILARHHEAIRSSLASAPRLLRWLLVAIALLLFQYASRIPVPWHLQSFIQGVGASYIILLALSHRSVFSRFLQLKPLLFLGRISYSLYLIHVPILMILSITLYGSMSYGYLLLPFLAIALVTATLFNRLVEVPSIHLGKLIGAAKTPAPAVASAV